MLDTTAAGWMLLFWALWWLARATWRRSVVAYHTMQRSVETTDFLLWILAGVSMALVVGALLRELR